MPIVDALARIEELHTLVQRVQSVGAERTAPAVSDAGSGDRAAAFATALQGARPATPVPAAGAGGGADGQAIVDGAMRYLGVPYVLGGDDETGMDCSGLVQRVLGELGIEAPRRASQQQHLGTEVGSLAEAQPGDLIVTHNADHIVIYAGDGMIVHAPYEGRTVSYQPNYLSDADIQTIRRVVPAAPAAVPAAGPAAVPAGGADAATIAALSALLGSGTTTGAAPGTGAGGLVDLVQAALFGGRGAAA